MFRTKEKGENHPRSQREKKKNIARSALICVFHVRDGSPLLFKKNERERERGRIGTKKKL